MTDAADTDPHDPQTAFRELFWKIVSKKVTPVMVCRSCGYGCWFFEGHIDYVLKIWLASCRKCGSGDKSLFGDFREDLL